MPQARPQRQEGVGTEQGLSQAGQQLGQFFQQRAQQQYQEGVTAITQAQNRLQQIEGLMQNPNFDPTPEQQAALNDQAEYWRNLMQQPPTRAAQLWRSTEPPPGQLVTEVERQVKNVTEQAQGRPDATPGGAGPQALGAGGVEPGTGAQAGTPQAPARQVQTETVTEERQERVPFQQFMGAMQRQAARDPMQELNNRLSLIENASQVMPSEEINLDNPVFQDLVQAGRFSEDDVRSTRARAVQREYQETLANAVEQGRADLLTAQAALEGAQAAAGPGEVIDQDYVNTVRQAVNTDVNTILDAARSAGCVSGSDLTEAVLIKDSEECQKFTQQIESAREPLQGVLNTFLSQSLGGASDGQIASNTVDLYDKVQEEGVDSLSDEERRQFTFGMQWFDWDQNALIDADQAYQEGQRQGGGSVYVPGGQPGGEQEGDPEGQPEGQPQGDDQGGNIFQRYFRFLGNQADAWRRRAEEDRARAAGREPGTQGGGVAPGTAGVMRGGQGAGFSLPSLPPDEGPGQRPLVARLRDRLAPSVSGTASASAVQGDPVQDTGVRERLLERVHPWLVEVRKEMDREVREGRMRAPGESAPASEVRQRVESAGVTMDDARRDAAVMENLSDFYRSSWQARQRLRSLLEGYGYDPDEGDPRAQAREFIQGVRSREEEGEGARPEGGLADSVFAQRGARARTGADRGEARVTQAGGTRRAAGRAGAVYEPTREVPRPKPEAEILDSEGQVPRGVPTPEPSIDRRARSVPTPEPTTGQPGLQADIDAVQRLTEGAFASREDIQAAREILERRGYLEDHPNVPTAAAAFLEDTVGSQEPAQQEPRQGERAGPQGAMRGGGSAREAQPSGITPSTRDGAPGLGGRYVEPESGREYRVGELTYQSEAAGDPASIGYDSGGGWSYGLVQLASSQGSVGEFVEFLRGSAPGMAQKLRQAAGDKSVNEAAADGDEEFQNAWKELASKNRDEFTNAQMEFAEETYLAPTVDAFRDLTQGREPSPRLQEVLLSTAVQHGASRSQDGGSRPKPGEYVRAFPGTVEAGDQISQGGRMEVIDLDPDPDRHDWQQMPQNDANNPYRPVPGRPTTAEDLGLPVIREGAAASGSAEDILRNAAEELSAGGMMSPRTAPEEAWIQAIYNERMRETDDGNLYYFRDHDANTQKGVRNRLRREQRILMNATEAPTNASPEGRQGDARGRGR